MFGSRRKKLTLADVLRGTTAGRIQAVGYMQVIPLLSDLVDDRFVSAAEGGALVSTRGYGTLVFENPSEHTLIVPCHAAYVVKRAAQDHAMAHAAVVKKHSVRAFDTAMCVEQTQPGRIPRANHKMIILPFALREEALALRRKTDFRKLWDALDEFRREMSLPERGHLEDFLSRFRRELDQFVAEFECVPKQVGAIVLVNDEVVGIERAPNHAFWQSVWPALIRECYGSLAVQVARRTDDATPPSTRVSLSDEIDSLDALANAVADAEREQRRRTGAIVRGLLDERLPMRVEERVVGLRLSTLDQGRFTGQLITDYGNVVYASLCASAHWRMQEAWRAARPFRI